MKHVLKNLGKLFHHQKIILNKLKLTESRAEDQVFFNNWLDECVLDTDDEDFSDDDEDDDEEDSQDGMQELMDLSLKTGKNFNNKVTPL